MHNIRKLIDLSVHYLTEKGISHARFCAEELLAHTLKCKRLDLYLDYEAPVESNEVDGFRSLIKQKAAGEPLGYLLGYVDFLDCRIKTTPDVLIPRQETEILVNLALKEVPNESKILWDLCAGSGCMGLAAKKHRPELKVALSDLSKAALSLAKENAAMNALNVDLFEGDLLEPFQGEKADFIFCNPPYISENEYSELEREVHFEPKMALVAGEEGYAFYKRLELELPQYLNLGAKIFFEIGFNQGKEVERIFSKSHWKIKSCEKDWAGHDRFFFLEFHP